MSDSESDDDQESDQTSLPEEGPSDAEALRVTRDEAREVLNKQIEKLDHIDSKAAETLRLNIVILGVLLTLSSLLVSERTPELHRFVNASIAVGVLFSFTSFVFALWTYTSTRKSTGPGPGDITRVRIRQYEEQRWLNLLLRSYEVWIQNNQRENKKDSRSLFASHIFLFMAMGYYTFGIVWGLFFHGRHWGFLIASILALSVLLPLIVLFPRLPWVGKIRDIVSEKTDGYWELLYDQ